MGRTQRSISYMYYTSFIFMLMMITDMKKLIIIKHVKQHVNQKLETKLKATNRFTYTEEILLNFFFKLCPGYFPTLFIIGIYVSTILYSHFASKSQDLLITSHFPWSAKKLLRNSVNANVHNTEIAKFIGPKYTGK